MNKIMIGFAGVVMVGAVIGSYMVGSEMGQIQGMNKILSEQEKTNSIAHTEWADFGGGMYIIGGEVISTDEENQTTTFELISGTQLTSKLGVFDSDAVYMLTVDDCNTPDYMNDDVIVVVWEAK